MSEKIRLNRYLSSCGIGSRRACETLIRQGCISINGQVVTELATRVGDNDQVYLRGQLLQPEQPMYILLNKPLGMLTTLKDDRGRKHVGQLFKQLPLVKPIGRLDLNTTGVLLLTNDGELHYRLTHPRFQIIRIYQLKVRGKILPETVRKLRLGVRLDDGKIARVVLRKLVFRDGISTFQLELREGRYREIRRLMTALGYKLLSLDRVAYAGITASGLRRGDWRFLADSEIEHLHDLANTGVR